MRTDRVMVFVLAGAATLGLFWILAPFRSAIVWAIAATILFSPLFRWLERRLQGRRNLAAMLSVLAMIVALVGPAVAAGAAFVRQAALLMTGKGGAVHLPASFDQLHARLPQWLHQALRLSGSDDVASVQRYVTRLLEGGLTSLLGGAIGIGQSAFAFAVTLGVMIYVSFFFIRDGRTIIAQIIEYLPLPEAIKLRFAAELGEVLRATLRGTLIVALVQGSVGGFIFWLLGIEAPAVWAFAMGFMALLPPFGAGAVWLPVAIFLLLTGSVWQGVTLILCGLLIIGLVDNLLRPFLVGRAARLPEYLVLLSTLGGLALLGFDGIVIGPVLVGMFLVAWRILHETLTEGR